MIVTLLLWLVICLTVFPYGLLSLHLLGRLGGKPTGFFHPVFIFLAGLAFLTLLADLVSLFSPLNQAASLAVMAGALLIWATLVWLRKPKFSLPTWKKPGLVKLGVGLLGGLIFLSVLDIASRTPGNRDTAIYHAQAIHWIQAYKAVAGLGNLTSRLAYNSNWLLDNALFSFVWVGGVSYHALPGLLVLLSLFYFLAGAWALVSGRPSPSAWLKTLLIPVLFFILPSEISSPGTDLPAILITWLILAESLDGTWLAAENLQSRQLLLGVLAVFAVTLKLSVVPLLILPGAMILVYALKKNLSWGLKMGLLGLLVMLPWMARNVMISGYLIYPFPYLDLFNVDWKIPLADVFTEVQTVNNWARHIWIGSNQHDYSLPLQEWAPLWFKAETANRRLMAVICAAGIPLASILMMVPPTRRWLQNHGVKGVEWVYLTAFCGCLFWFLTAPDFRFGFSFIIFTILLLAYPLYHAAGGLKLNRPFYIAGVLILALLLNQAWFYQASFQSRTLSARIILPENYLTAPTATCQFGNFSVWCAQLYDQCWYTPFPCVPRAVPEVILRGVDFEDGFRLKGK